MSLPTASRWRRQPNGTAATQDTCPSHLGQVVPGTVEPLEGRFDSRRRGFGSRIVVRRRDPSDITRYNFIDIPDSEAPLLNG